MRRRPRRRRGPPNKPWHSCNQSWRSGKRLVFDLTAGGRFLLVGVVTAAGAHLQVVIARGMGFHTHGAATALGARVGGPVRDAVLVADIVGHGPADLSHVV